MSFKSALSDLASQLETKFDLGNNKDPNALDSLVDGKLEKFGNLGDYASQIDQSAIRKYVEQGYLRNDAFQTSSKQFEVWFQNPKATVLVKKRMFSSIADNFRPDFMDSDEKLYFRAIKTLFANKCKQIAAFEKLSKIEAVSTLTGKVDDQLIPIIISLTDTISSSNTTRLTGDQNSLLEIVNRLRRVDAFTKSAESTTWLTDGTQLFSSLLGLGTGVIEVTNFTNFTTTCPTTLNGSFSLTISDPYELMRITEFDIERAISDASSFNTKVSGVISQIKNDGSATYSDLITRLNQYRTARGASTISFKVDNETLFGQRITAIVDRRGIELPFDYSATAALTLGLAGSLTVADPYLLGGEILENDGLNKSNAKDVRHIDDRILKSNNRSEFDLFADIIKTKLAEIALSITSTNKLFITTGEANYARKNMMNSFLGKLIIQSMDTVHFYIDSQARKDSNLTTGIESLFAGSNPLQNSNNSVVSTADAFTSLFCPQQNINFQLEKAAFVGPDFPNYLWNVVRSTFTGEKEGVHVFAGIVDTANESYSNGVYSVAIRGKDNSAYFEQGKVNYKPGADNFNGSIFDPLTPFKTSFDTVVSNTTATDYKFLAENESQMLSVNPFLKLKLGRYPGKPVGKSNYIQDQAIDPQTGRLTKTFYAPDGTVYQWKQGIGVFVQFGNSQDLNNFNKVGTQSIYNQPFAGQDIMNTLSLLISGTPYNFATYWNAVTQTDSYKKDPQANKSSAGVYTQYFNQELIKRNSLWGNFVPFKNLVIDEEYYKVELENQASYINENTDLQTSLAKLQELNDQSAIYNLASIFDPNGSGSEPEYAKTKAQADQLEIQINQTIMNLDAKRHNDLNTVGTDVSLDVSSFIHGDEAKSAYDPKARKAFRRQLNYLTRRPSYQVRANEDKNLLVIDDFYDKDFDLLAFDKKIGNLSQYNGQYLSVKEKIETVSQLLNLEVFCDTQGNVRIRPPQYNRMPSSVFYKMMQLKKEKNIQVFPDFLNSLFKDQIQVLQSRLEVIEDYIRLDCAVVGISDDISASTFISSDKSGAVNVTDQFFFLTNQDSGLLESMQDMLRTANPEEESQDSNFSLLTKQSTLKNVFNNASKAQKLLTGIKGNQKLIDNGYSVFDVPTYNQDPYIDTLINRLFIKSGRRVPRDYFVLTTTLASAQQGTSRLDFFKAVNDLSDKLAERQKIVKLLASSVKASSDFSYVDSNSGATVTKLLTPSNYNSGEIPETFAHMIEDETYDDFGLGSGNRYVIRSSQIKSLSIVEQKPEFTFVEVQGTLNEFDPDALSPGLKSFTNGGNGQVTALAVDYNSWRNYGFSGGSTITVPFLTDPNTQCGPYAASILSRERKNIFRGTVTIIGNEFSQPGEVIFLETHGMLFYVTQVEHSFTHGSPFSTTLTLTYGHVPGDYIPTTLDIIGKLLYKNRDVADMVVQRFSSPSGEENIGVILRDQNSPLLLNSSEKNEFKNANSDTNISTLKNMIFQTLYKLNQNQQIGTNQKFQIELRLYSSLSDSPNEDMRIFRNQIKDILLGTVDFPTQLSSNVMSGPLKSFIKEEDLLLTTVDLDKKDESKSPSQKALDAARSLPTQTIGSSLYKDVDKLKSGLINCVVDCFVIQTEVTNVS